MDLERERGITIKSHAIQMDYVLDGEKYILNLIDTPGHVDFSYEVSRSIAACEGALLVVDAAQSIQAQTISNLYLALENGLTIIPVLNKIDLPSAKPEEVADDIVALIDCRPEDIIYASGKTGQGVEDILRAIVERIPAPEGDPDAPLQALVFDSVFNSFRGVEAYYKVVNGTIHQGEKVKFMATGKSYLADEVGTLKLKKQAKKQISAGDVGYVISGIKEAVEVKVGDTITSVERPAAQPIEGFEEVKPMVFAGIYPVDTEDYEELRSSMEKLHLNDAALTFEAESSAALGFGFRCGFLGMLHLEIIQERLEREFGMTVITTVPNVSYRVYQTSDRNHPLTIHNPSELPDPSRLDRVEEPYIRASIITQSEYIGPVMELCIAKRGVLKNQSYPHPGGAHLRVADGRSGIRLLRPAQVPLARIRLVRLHAHRLPPGRPGQGRYPDQRRTGRCTLLSGTPRQCVQHRQEDRREAPRPDPPPAIRHSAPGGHRRQDHRPRNDQGCPQGRYRQVLRRRHLPQTQAARKTETR